MLLTEINNLKKEGISDHKLISLLVNYIHYDAFDSKLASPTSHLGSLYSALMARFPEYQYRGPMFRRDTRTRQHLNPNIKTIQQLNQQIIKPREMNIKSFTKDQTYLSTTNAKRSFRKSDYINFKLEQSGKGFDVHDFILNHKHPAITDSFLDFFKSEYKQEAEIIAPLYPSCKVVEFNIRHVDDSRHLVSYNPNTDMQVLRDFITPQE